MHAFHITNVECGVVVAGVGVDTACDSSVWCAAGVRVWSFGVNKYSFIYPPEGITTRGESLDRLVPRQTSFLYFKGRTH